MGFRKKKKVEEVIAENTAEVAEKPAEEEVVTGEIEAVEEPVEEVKDEILPLDDSEEPVKEEAPKVETDIRVGNKVLIKVPRDYAGRPITVDDFSFYTVYAIEGDKVQLRGQFGRILFVKLSNIKKIK